MTELYVKIPMSENEKDFLNVEFDKLRFNGISKINKPDFFKIILNMVAKDNKVRDILKDHIKKACQ